jgi:hypothetical protein
MVDDFLTWPRSPQPYLSWLRARCLFCAQTSLPPRRSNRRRTHQRQLGLRNLFDSNPRDSRHRRQHLQRRSFYRNGRFRSGWRGDGWHSQLGSCRSQNVESQPDSSPARRLRRRGATNSTRNHTRNNSHPQQHQIRQRRQTLRDGTICWHHSQGHCHLSCDEARLYKIKLKHSPPDRTCGDSWHFIEICYRNTLTFSTTP